MVTLRTSKQTSAQLGFKYCVIIDVQENYLIFITAFSLYTCNDNMVDARNLYLAVWLITVTNEKLKVHVRTLETDNKHTLTFCRKAFFFSVFHAKH
jgi:hypothetical protein